MYYTSLEAETPMLILWPLLQPPRHRAYLGLSLLKTCANLLRWRTRWSMFIKLGWDLAGWTLSCYSLRRISCPRGSSTLTKCKERLLSFGCLRTKSYTNALFSGHIYCAPWGIRATLGGVTWRDLWEPHRMQIVVSQSPHSGILVAEHVKESTRACEQVWPMPEICPIHSLTRWHP